MWWSELLLSYAIDPNNALLLLSLVGAALFVINQSIELFSKVVQYFKGIAVLILVVVTGLGVTQHPDYQNNYQCIDRQVESSA